MKKKNNLWGETIVNVDASSVISEISDKNIQPFDSFDCLFW